MSFIENFSGDVQFLRLVRRETDVDLVTAALELAKDEQKDLQFEPVRETLQRAVSRLTHPVTQAGSDLEELKLLVRYMTEELGLHGDPAYLKDPGSHYLNYVLATGRGIPISLSLLYLHVANELGIPLQPISTPARFLTRLQTDSGNLYVDAFDRGRILNEVECIALIREITGATAAEIRRHLRPTDDRSIGSQEQWTAAWRVQCRLKMLIPGSWRERRDHAILTLRSGRYGEAIELLEQGLSVCPLVDRPFLENHLQQAKRLLPECN
jgi:regulator of sirC expression with transglutaminase-like and TPR domain